MKSFVTFLWSFFALAALASFVMLGIAYKNGDEKLINFMLDVCFISAIIWFLMHCLKNHYAKSES